jgi:hypothetical protein
MSLTASQFEKRYATSSGLTVVRLRRWRTVRPCRCDSADCERWQSINYRSAWEDGQLYGWSRWRVLGDFWRRLTTIFS